jgi:hypothetical protein
VWSTERVIIGRDNARRAAGIARDTYRVNRHLRSGTSAQVQFLMQLNRIHDRAPAAYASRVQASNEPVCSGWAHRMKSAGEHLRHADRGKRRVCGGILSSMTSTHSSFTPSGALGAGTVCWRCTERLVWCCWCSGAIAQIVVNDREVSLLARGARVRSPKTSLSETQGPPVLCMRG